MISQSLMKLSLVAAFSAATVSGSVSIATAQDSSAPAPQDQMEPDLSADEIPDEVYEGFAEAAITLAEIRDSYMLELAEARDEDEEVEIAEEANEAMMMAVDEIPDISIDDYMAIGQAAAFDDGVNARVMEAIENKLPEGAEFE